MQMSPLPRTQPLEPSPSSGAVARDGSPVEIYRLLPPDGEPQIIHAALRQGARILDLGCGTGRIAAPLVELGHAVAGVDDSPEMLAAMDPRVEPMLGDGRTVRLDRRFEAVLLGSHLLNDRDAAGFLATALAHLDYGGLLIAEVYPPTMDWAAAVGRTSDLGPVEVTVIRAEIEGCDLDAEVRYRLGDRSWHQPFVARMRDESELRALLVDSGFAFDRWLDALRGWFVARRETGR